MLTAAALSGCQRKPMGTAQPVVMPDAGREAVALIAAARCGECHGKQEREWRSSAHARADGSPLYRAMRAAAPAASCDRCHAPLRAISASDPTVAEGVTCDVCHTIASVQVGRAGGAGFVMHLEDSVRYGPLCDAAPHYFHTMGCSPLHSEAEFCAACHDLRTALPAGGTLTVFPEYSEWHAGSAADSGQTCQLCHMKGERAEVAVGSPARASVRSHGFELRGALLKRALTGRATARASTGKLHVTVALTNSGAGHAVPSSLPERQLLIGVEVVDGVGRVLARREASLGRLLVDANDREVPFYKAVRQRTDTRIPAGSTHTESFEFDLFAATALRIAVAWRPISPTLAAQLGVAAPPDEPMIAGSLPLPLGRRKAGEAAVVELAP